jgi:hypothetical protein
VDPRDAVTFDLDAGHVYDYAGNLLGNFLNAGATDDEFKAMADGDQYPPQEERSENG